MINRSAITSRTNQRFQLLQAWLVFFVISVFINPPFVMDGYDEKSPLYDIWLFWIIVAFLFGIRWWPKKSNLHMVIDRYAGDIFVLAMHCLFFACLFASFLPAQQEIESYRKSMGVGYFGISTVYLTIRFLRKKG